MNFFLNRISYLLKNGIFGANFSQHRNAKKIVWQKKILPQVTIEDITNEKEPILDERTHVDGNVSLAELRCIAKLVQFYQPKTLFEIGTFDGRTTLNMALNAPDAEIWTLDLPKAEVHQTRFRIKKGDRKFVDKSKSGTRFSNTPYADKITQIYSDSAQYDYSLLEGTIDFVFIDGAHTHEYVLNDTEVAFNLLRNGKGVLIWHDYQWKEVIHALNSYFESDNRFKSLKHIQGTTLAVLVLD